MNPIIYWLKFILFYLVIKFRPWISNGRTSGLAKRRQYSMVEKEIVRHLVKEDLSIDASYFNGFDYNGRFLGLGMQRRPNGRCESVFFVRMPEICPESLVLHTNPNTWTSCNDNEWRTEDGLRFDMREPMQRWNVSFDGEVMENVSRKKYRLKFDFEWTRRSPIFDCDTDMDCGVMADAIASHEWSKDFFRNLKELHQAHYEIFGELIGTLSINNSPPIDLSLISMKDRSYGQYRNWGDFKRYILHYLATEDGMYIGCHFVSITKTFSHLLVGFVLDSKGKKVAIRSCSKTLSDIGDDSLPFTAPYSYQCIDTEGKAYNVTVTVMERVKFFCGEDKDGTLFSAYVHGTVNGVRMAGLCEYEYNSEQYSELLDKSRDVK